MASQLVGAVSSAVSGGDPGLSTDIAGYDTQYNYLNHNRPNMMSLSEKEKYENAVAACSGGDQVACTTRNELAVMSAQRDQDLQSACSGATPVLCNALASEAREMGNIVYRDGAWVYANSAESGLIRYLNTASIGSSELSAAYENSYHYLQSESVSYGLPILGVAAAGSLGSQWLLGQMSISPLGSLGGAQLIKGAGVSGAMSTLIYGAMKREEMTPAGLATAFTAGAIGGGLVKQGLNYGAGLANTAIPLTGSNLITQGTGAVLGFSTIGWINWSGTASGGNSWWTSPLFGSNAAPSNKEGGN